MCNIVRLVENSLFAVWSVGMLTAGALLGYAVGKDSTHTETEKKINENLECIWTHVQKV